jgi:hypothetical protein
VFEKNIAKFSLLMKRYIIYLSILFTLFGCKSIPEKVKLNKEKFIQVAKENCKPIDPNNLVEIYEQAKSNDVERKMKYLGVDNIQTVYGLSNSNGINLDSIVIFTKSDYKIIYDFSISERQIETIKQNCGLNNLEKIDSRLYIGQK